MLIRRDQARLFIPPRLGDIVGAKPPGGPGENFLLRSSLQCYYKFENASDLGEDYKGNIPLTNVNTVTQSATIPSGTYAAPTTSKSADCEADSNQYLTASDAEASEIDNLTAASIVMWVKPETLTTEDFPFNRGGTGAGMAISLNTSGIRGYFGGVDTGWKTASMAAGAWFFIALTYNQIGDVILLYEGTETVQIAQVGTTAAVDKTEAGSAAFYIGRAPSDGYNYDGLICEVAVFSELLTLAELQDYQQYGIDGSG